MPLTVSDAFKDAVTKVHRPTRRVVLTDTDGDDHTLLIRSGSLTWTAGGYPSCQASIEVADLDDAPLTGNSYYKPYGSRVKVYAGYVLPSGVTDEVLVADLVVTGVEEMQPEQTLALTAMSDEELIRTDEFAMPTPKLSYGGYSGAFQNVQAIIYRTLPSAVIVVEDALIDPGLADDTTWDGDAWGCVVECLEALEAEAWVRPDRAFVLRSASTPAGTPDVTLKQGTADATIVGVTSTWQRGTNTVTVRGGDVADGTTISGDASATSTQSPTGDMGPVRLVTDYPTDGTAAMLDDAAAGLLRKTQRKNRTVTVDTMPKPWVVLGDTARVTWADGSTEDFIVRSVALSLTPGDPQTLELAEAVS